MFPPRLNVNSFALDRLKLSEVIKRMSTEVLREIFQKSVDSVEPRRLIRESVKIAGSHLLVSGESLPMKGNCFIVGFGKAVLGMAVELEGLLGFRLKRGLVMVPEGIFERFPLSEDARRTSKINFIEGAKNNLPDKSASDGAIEIKKMTQSLSENDLLFVLISGGGSALLPLPKPPITLEEKQDLIRTLTGNGADIVELNCVRKQISQLKGGGLARIAYPASLVSLILSDIVGDPIDFIASGPTQPNFDQPEDAIKIIKNYMSSYDTVPISIRSVLEMKRAGGIDQRDLIAYGKYKHVRNFVVGNNRRAAEAACNHAKTIGFQSTILSTNVSGSVTKISQIYAQLARNLASIISDTITKQDLRTFLDELKISNNELIDHSAIEDMMGFDFSKPQGVCIIAAGEPTVIVKGNGKGGRNQQLALELSLKLNNKLNVKLADISFLSAGTDGIDGPTDAAGAIGTLNLVNNSRVQNIKPEDYLNNNDSYSFFAKYSGGTHLIKIGHTGTNVMDIHILIVKPKLLQ